MPFIEMLIDHLGVFWRIDTGAERPGPDIDEKCDADDLVWTAGPSGPPDQAILLDDEQGIIAEWHLDPTQE